MVSGQYGRMYRSMTTREEDLIKKVPEDYRDILSTAICQMVSLEKDIETLSAIPHIRYSKDRKTQEALPAGALYMKKSNLYLSYVSLLLKALSKTTPKREEADIFTQAMTFTGDDDVIS